MIERSWTILQEQRSSWTLFWISLMCRQCLQLKSVRKLIQAQGSEYEKAFQWQHVQYGVSLSSQVDENMDSTRFRQEKQKNDV